ncbi:MAG: hypothetical protein VZR73_11480 [Acutalibacteraceae bacterium]|nr:hypothetical protein [Acutalibacteraceae bacterium]
MKKIREMILDFTPLLDVTMILLFYFILFSHMGAADATSKAEQAMKEAKEATANAAQMIQDAEALQHDAEEHLAILEEANQDAAAMAEGINQYRTGENHISLLLLPHGEQLMLEMKRDDKSLGIWETEQITKSLMFDEFVKTGFDRDSYIFCNLIYNSRDDGTQSAVSDIRKVLDNVQREFKNLYQSETDLVSE